MIPTFEQTENLKKESEINHEKYIYIDIENINNLTSLVDIDVKCFIFVGASQKTINAELVLASNNKLLNGLK
ncbi:MAG: hypothetical protein GX639_02900 [Fibrobacter sp.]|nr:hypothetical protein [Fibrobacter sp.]